MGGWGGGGGGLHCKAVTNSGKDHRKIRGPRGGRGRAGTCMQQVELHQSVRGEGSQRHKVNGVELKSTLPLTLALRREEVHTSSDTCPSSGRSPHFL